MKRLIALLLFPTQFLLAQDAVTVKEESATIGGENRNCFTVMIKGASADDVQKDWKKTMKDMKGKVSDKDVIFADDCKDKSMGDNTFDVYAVVEEITDSLLRLVVAYDLGGAYLNSTEHPDKAVVANSMVREFAVTQSKNAVQAKIDASEKQLKGLEKDLEKLVKDKEKLEKDIRDNQNQIAENKSSIASNIEGQKSKQKEIHKLEDAQLETPMEDAEKLLKDYEKQLSGMKKDRSKMEKDNEKLADKIKSAQDEIEQNLKDQANKKTEIESAKTKINTLKLKLNAIN